MRNIRMKEIDIREIRLGKWQIPNSGKRFGGSDGLAIGYFDEISAVSGKKEGQHPLVSAYEHSYRINKDKGRDEDKGGVEDKGKEEDKEREYSVQEIKAFTNIIDEKNESEDSITDENPKRDGFRKEEIRTFWEDESCLIYVSMIHIDLEMDINSVIDKIREIFGNCNQFLYYITFDYSGIVILVKGIPIWQYTGMIFRLNYEMPIVIRDSFSVIAFHKNKIEDFFEGKADEARVCELLREADSGQYSITVNISIRDYEKYMKFNGEMEKYKKENRFQVTRKQLLGRHDVSLINENGNLIWLLYVQRFLNRYSPDAFWDYETLIKIDGSFQPENSSLPLEKSDEKDEKDKKDSKVWNPAIKEMNEAYQKFKEKAEELDYLVYMVPVREVIGSIKSILNNLFAEDFVICIFESFLSFIKYLISKMEEESQTEDRVGYRNNFDNCYHEYFACFNAMVNSAMHTERQFVQVTGFNPIFYDIPPKLMAFYTAVVHRLQKIMRLEGDKNYTFILSPGFSNEIYVKVISYKGLVMPQDRLLQVNINEKALYDPEKVIRVMAHEIAHYVGDKNRCRPERKGYVLDTLVYFVLISVLEGVVSIDDRFMKLKEDVIQIMQAFEGFQKDCEYYSEDLQYLYLSTMQCMAEDEMIHRAIRNYIRDRIGELAGSNYLNGLMAKDPFGNSGTADWKDKKLSEIEANYILQVVWRDIEERIIVLNREKRLIFEGRNALWGDYSMEQYMGVLLSLYSETYADLQMILLLGITYEEYLRSFLKTSGSCADREKPDFNVETVEEYDADWIRISVIARVMQDVGLWKCGIEENRGRLSVLDEKVKKAEQEMKLSDALKENGKKLRQKIKAADSELWPINETPTEWTEEPTVRSYQSVVLYEYLALCMEKSINYYMESQKEEIDKLRKINRMIQEFNDIPLVYSKVCGVITEYRSELVHAKSGQQEEGNS